MNCFHSVTIVALHILNKCWKTLPTMLSSEQNRTLELTEVSLSIYGGTEKSMQKNTEFFLKLIFYSKHFCYKLFGNVPTRFPSTHLTPLSYFQICIYRYFCQSRIFGIRFSSSIRQLNLVYSDKHCFSKTLTKKVWWC